MYWLTSNPAWMSVIIAALSLGVSIWAIISARRSNKRVEEYNNNSIRLQYRPVIDFENGWMVNQVDCVISFNLISLKNEARITKIDVLNKGFACCQPRTFPIHLVTGDVVLLAFACFHTESFMTAPLSVDIYYEDIIGNAYKTHIEGNQSGLKSNPAQFLS